MATPIEVQIPWMRYDVALPLMEGRVAIDGVNLTPTRSAPNGTVLAPDSPLKSGNFGLADLNMANWLPAIEAGWDFVGLPVFAKRKHLYTYLFCRADAGIACAKDLEGKRVLATVTSSAVALWLKSLLSSRHGVDLDSITWVSPREQWPIHTSRWTVANLEQRKSVVEVLADGDADAAMVDVSDRKLWHVLESDPRFKRVFPDYLGEAGKPHPGTGGYLPVHMMVMSGRLDRAHPDLAGKLCAAFAQAKELSYGDILDDRSGFALVDLREEILAERKAWGDLFPVGLRANRAMIDAFIALCHDHGTIKAAPAYEQVFAASTLDT